MPKIEIMPATKLTVTGGDTVVFRCVVKAGNPPPAVVWETEESERLNSSDDGILMISPASGAHQGKYICRATNVLGSTRAVALLIVQGKPHSEQITIQCDHSFEEYFSLLLSVHSDVTMNFPCYVFFPY